MVRALASHQCDPGLILRPAVICGLSLLLVLYSAPRGFSPGTPVFPSPQKPTFPNSNSIWNARTFLNELLGVPWVDKLHLHLQHGTLEKFCRFRVNIEVLDGTYLYLYGAKHGDLNFVLKCLYCNIFLRYLCSVLVVERWGKDTFNERSLKITPLESLTMNQGLLEAFLCFVAL